eukprot:CAMPEP_0172459922 /NCGR_PEP_ID=MMETSP1065-20121228/34733_1 /TAXON_ID=265537 /ORGANISM="Amphiprora paludosa, Strain CCMP125" /LENGTH=165 /DNA_ID=CAMNT_0013214781 /DNA_START=128 /DNA_END=625 /DNA_ORIENTATION=+
MFSFEKIKPVVKKAFTFNLNPTEDSFPELPTILIWFRFVLAVGYGLYVGTKLVNNAVVLIQALNLIAFIPTVYCKFFLGVSAEVFPMETIFAGLPNAMALCILIWVYMFTAANEESEAQLTSLLLSAVAPNLDGSVGGEAGQAFDGGAAASASTPPVSEQEAPEF